MDIRINSQVELDELATQHDDLVASAWEHDIPVVIPDMSGAPEDTCTTFKFSSNTPRLHYIFEGGAHAVLADMYKHSYMDDFGGEHSLTVDLRGSSHAFIQGGSEFTVYVRDNAQVTAQDSEAEICFYGSAYGNTIACKHVTAYKESTVNATDCTNVEARDGSRVIAHGKTHVFADDNSTVFAFDSADVQAYGSASVFARGNARVIMRDTGCVTVTDSNSASVTSGDGRTIRVFEDTSTPVQGKDEGKDEGNE